MDSCDDVSPKILIKSIKFSYDYTYHWLMCIRMWHVREFIQSLSYLLRVCMCVCELVSLISQSF